MPERAHRTFFSVDSHGKAEIDYFPDDEIIAEIERTREILFNSGNNAINNFRDNMPGGRRRYENDPPNYLKEFIKEHPKEYVEYWEFFEDIDRAFREAGLEREVLGLLQEQHLQAVIVASESNFQIPEIVEVCAKIGRELNQYIFPVYEILRLKYGYSGRDLCA
jgi:hypothetical protein